MKKILAILLICLVAISFCGCAEKIECDYCLNEKRNVSEVKDINGNPMNICQDCYDEYKEDYDEGTESALAFEEALIGAFEEVTDK